MGRIQSIQSFSTFDGPGTRSVVFLQGCPVRCLFCHNPDSWDINGGEEINVAELLRRLESFRPFLETPGLTLSGGEPLVQPEFTLEIISKAKLEGWHVALDTSGWGPNETFIEVAAAADLIMFSIKHPLTPEKVVQCNYEPMITNWRALATLSVPVILRYVLIPGWTDQLEALQTLKELASGQPHLKRIEILPFNDLAIDKWHMLQRKSPLFDGTTPVVSEEQIRKAEEILRK